MINSFKYAGEGLVWSVKNHRNTRMYILIAILVLLLALVLKVSRVDWLILIFTISFVFIAEMLNTAIEEITNLITIKWAHQAKVAKDVAAGMSLVAAVTAAIVGLIIFLPYFFR